MRLYDLADMGDFKISLKAGNTQPQRDVSWPNARMMLGECKAKEKVVGGVWITSGVAKVLVSRPQWPAEFSSVPHRNPYH